MIEGLFNQPSYLAAKKTLDAVAVRQEAIANNIANLETPGYKRVDLSPTFNAELDRAVSSGGSKRIEALKPMVSVDPAAVIHSGDGNTVTGRKPQALAQGAGQPHRAFRQLAIGYDHACAGRRCRKCRMTESGAFEP